MADWGLQRIWPFRSPPRHDIPDWQTLEKRLARGPLRLGGALPRAATLDRRPWEAYLIVQPYRKICIMDVLSDILDLLQLRGSLYFRTAFTPPFAVAVPPLDPPGTRVTS